MLSKQDNDLLCRVGPGTPMGELMRQYWMPAARSRTSCRRPDCPPLRVTLLGEDLIAFRDDLRRGRPDPERLPPPRRLDVLRAQRGRGPALRLPRLEVRRHRRLRRHALRARREQLQEQGAHEGLPDASSATASSGPTWARATTAAAAARLRGQHGRRAAVVQQRSCASATGCRRWKATSTRATSASCTSAPSSRKTPSRAASTTTRSSDRLAEVRRASTPSSAPLRRLPAGRGGHLLLAHRPLPLPVLHA